MGILIFDKPKKLRSTADHNEMYQSDSGISGTYVSNMSHDDEMKWKAKHIKGAEERIEIRKLLGGANAKIIVYKEVRLVHSNDWKERQKNHRDIVFSTNGKMDITFTEFGELVAGIMEAIDILGLDKVKMIDIIEQMRE